MHDFSSPPVVFITITVIPIAAERPLHDFPGNEVNVKAMRSAIISIVFVAVYVYDI